MANETYVHGETEVKKTGRVAEKIMPNKQKLLLVEITPVNSYDGDWKKWVNPTSLFTIQPDNIPRTG